MWRAPGRCVVRVRAALVRAALARFAPARFAPVVRYVADLIRLLRAREPTKVWAVSRWKAVRRSVNC